MFKILHIIATTTAIAVVPLAAMAQDDSSALAASIAAPDGNNLGQVTARLTASGQMLVTLDLSGLPPGTHAVHVHETGDCSADDFTSAGGHLANGMEHGVMSADGSHPGDLPNIHVPDSGQAMIEYFAPALTADLMMDDDGAAFVIHADADDYSGQPSGNAGARIGCGVFAPAG